MAITPPPSSGARTRSPASSRRAPTGWGRRRSKRTSTTPGSWNRSVWKGNPNRRRRVSRGWRACTSTITARSSRHETCAPGWRSQIGQPATTRCRRTSVCFGTGLPRRDPLDFVAHLLQLGEQPELGGLPVFGAEVLKGDAHPLLVFEAAEADHDPLGLPDHGRHREAFDARQTHEPKHEPYATTAWC